MQSADPNSVYAPIVPADAIQRVAERWRLCRYLFIVAGLWTLVGGSLWLAYVFLDVPRLQMPGFVIQMIGYALFSVATAVRFALYRCPFCSASLSKLALNETICRKCHSQVKAIK